MKFKEACSVLLTDLYELTMIAGYYDHGRQDDFAVFEYFFRALPKNYGYAIFAGLESLLDDLEQLHFTADEIEYLRSLGIFKESLLKELSHFKFHGDLWAFPEGSLIFPAEPILRVQGPLAQVQLIETLVLNHLNYPTLVASKAARVVYAAQGDPVWEFGLRRAQGPNGGLCGARAAVIGGCAGTSNVMAGYLYGAEVSGTQAHSWIMSYPSELQAFRDYSETFPDSSLFLVDTYDTLESGVPHAIEVFKEMRARGWQGRAAIRLDSGDLARLSKEAYRMLIEAGFDDPVIVGSSELDEYLISELKHQGAKINVWGVGTKLITCWDEPALGGIYKLKAIEQDQKLVAKMKVSSNPLKTTDPGVQIPVRFYSPDGVPIGDVLFLEHETIPNRDVLSHDRHQLDRTITIPASASHQMLHQLMMKDGKRTHLEESLDVLQSRAREQIAVLPTEMQRLVNPEIYPVGLSTATAKAKREAIRRYSSHMSVIRHS